MKNNKDMKSHIKSTNPDSEPFYYEIKVQGQLDPQRSKWFEGMALTNLENSETGLAFTQIAGPVIDQPALYGLLTKIRDLNLTLISVRRSIPGTSTVEKIPLWPAQRIDAQADESGF